MKRRKITALCRMAMIVAVLWVQPGLAQHNFARYNIVDFGAVNDGATLSTAAINAAIATCSEKGGGAVIVPAGKFLSGTIFMRDNVELHLAPGALLLASTNRKDFPRLPQPAYRSLKDKGGWFALIYAEGAERIAVTGYGAIDGNGALQRPDPSLYGGDLDGRPRNILFISCKGVRVEGVRLLNSGMWNQHYLDCEDVIIDRIEVYNHSNRNNDGIDIDGCRRFVLSNSILDSDDDAITLKSTGPAPTEDVVITNCVVSSFCNAIKAGTESSGGFRNITISNCVVRPSRSATPPIFNTPRRGITGISLEIVDGGIMEGVTISNITIEGTECPLYIRLGDRARKYAEDVPAPCAGVMRNISVNNLVAYRTGNFSSSITAVPGRYIENVQLDNIQFFNTGGLKEDEFISDHRQVEEDEKGYPQPTVWGNLPSSFLFIRHVRDLALTNFMFGSDAGDPRVPVIAVNVERLRIEGGAYRPPGDANTIAPVAASSPQVRNTLAPSVPFALLEGVKEYQIKKPLGWGRQKVVISASAQPKK